MVEIKSYNFLSDSNLVPALSGTYVDIINPSTGEPCGKVADASTADVEIAIQAARLAFDYGKWPTMGVAKRAELLLRVGALIRTHAKELAELETLSTGKTMKHTTFIDVPTCAETFEYYGQLSESLLTETINVAHPVLSQVEREPVGVVVAIIPSNYPLIMTAWKIAPALLAGNCVVLKPAIEGCLAVLRLAQLIHEVGFPKGVINIITSSRVEAGEEMVKHPMVNMVSFTGSTASGRKVMATAASGIKKLTLELGGKSANIIFADCDIDAAIGGSLSAIFMNSGQMCTAGSRLFVEDRVYDLVVPKIIERAKQLKIGPADNVETEFGPMVSAKIRDLALAAIERARSAGATIACGGKEPLGMPKGSAYIEPTVLTQVRNDMAIAQEEIFGPVLSVMRFSSIDQVVDLANDSPYGLAAVIWSKDLFKANSVAKRLRVGTVWINTYGVFLNEAPFGGVKQSGFGRELGKEGLHEYTQVKHIATDQTPGGKALVTSWF